MPYFKPTLQLKRRADKSRWCVPEQVAEIDAVLTSKVYMGKQHTSLVFKDEMEIYGLTFKQFALFGDLKSRLYTRISTSNTANS